MYSLTFESTIFGSSKISFLWLPKTSIGSGKLIMAQSVKTNQNYNNNFVFYTFARFECACVWYVVSKL